MVLIPNALESSIIHPDTVPKFWCDGFMSEVLTNGQQTGVWLYRNGSSSPLRWIPEDTINETLEALEAQGLDILFSGVDYPKRE
jgi:hypothetical protein